jgi:hypothetical protein
MRIFGVSLLALMSFIVLAQDEKQFGIRFTGFVKTDLFYDSRQTVCAREGHFFLYPRNEFLDAEGLDINADGKFNMLSIQTRLTGHISGPDAFGAKTAGLIEGAFFGNINSDINGFRLRHAFVKLTWEKAELLVGQFWHPMFVTASYPGTISFNTGAPFEPFSRNPQVRFSRTFGRFRAVAAIMEQIDFKDTGPDGESPKYLINSGIPEMNLHLEYKSDLLLVGGGVNHKVLRPRLSYTNTFYGLYPETIDIVIKMSEKVSGTSVFGYVKSTTEPLTVKLYGVYGQLMYAMTKMGGYAEREISKENFYMPPQPFPGSDPQQKVTNISYTPYNTLSTWIDMHTNGKPLQAGLFAGYSKNMGTTDPFAGETYARGDDIDYLYRIAPRLIYRSGHLEVSPEIEYTVAAYATKATKTQNLNRDAKGKITESSEIPHFRFLVGVYYNF